jgi:DNA-binding MarR family transcriptional regulator
LTGPPEEQADPATGLPSEPADQRDDLHEEAAPSALAGYTGHLLRRVYGRAVQAAQTVMPDGSHPREFVILGKLAERDATSQQDLAEQLKINRTMMVKIIDKLESAGYVVRRRNPDDRRSYLISVTPAGRAALVEVGPAFSRGEELLTSALDEAERARLSALLRRLLPEVVDGLPEEFHDRSGYLLTRAHHRLRRIGDEALGELGIQIRHFGVLTELATTGTAAQQELAARLGVTEPAMVLIIDELERAGLVERGRHPGDRRRYAVALTESGTDRLAEARRRLGAIQRQLRGALGEHGDEELHALLTKLLEAPPVQRSH